LGLKLCGTYEHLVYPDDANVLEEKDHEKRNSIRLEKGVGLEAKAFYRVTRLREKNILQKYLINTSEMWQSSYAYEQQQHSRTAFSKNLRAD
jgi:hypothetical protein